MMNIFHFNLLFTAWKARSVTLSLIFALAMQGIWAGAELRDIFRSTGMYWFQVWILPFVIVALFAKYEPKFIPHEKVRRWLSIGLIIGSLACGGAIVRYEKKTQKEEASISSTRPAEKSDSFKKLGTKNGAR